MTPNRYQPPGPPPVARPLHSSPEEAEAARQSHADTIAGLRERRERKATEAAERREASAKAEGFESADAKAAAVKRAAQGVAGRRVADRFRRPT